MRRSSRGQPRQRYPVSHTSPWLFVVLAVGTVFFIVAGVFSFEPVMRVFRWLAVVL